LIEHDKSPMRDLFTRELEEGTKGLLLFWFVTTFSEIVVVVEDVSFLLASGLVFLSAEKPFTM